MPREVARPLQRVLLDWYRKGSRKDLPWRKSRNPYRVWVSEAMLQQTQVATVIPYYRRFLRRFPTVQVLSRAPLTDVLESWSGLGYYSRAKNLHACAQRIVQDHSGKLPDQVDTLMKLPGIGRTTAGAIASIAFDRPAPVLDGNVLRVFSRYFGIREDPRSATVQRRLWELAERHVPREAPGDFNQALMDLGATVCTPRRPNCADCPLSAGCVAHRRGRQDSIPPPRPVPRRRKLSYPCALLLKNDSVLVARRPIAALLPGLWEFPGGEPRTGESPLTALRNRLSERLGIDVEEPKPLMTIRQLLSHRELEIRVFSCRWNEKELHLHWYTQAKWIPLKALGKVPFTAGMAKAAGQIREKSR